MFDTQHNNNERSDTESPEQFLLLQKYQLTLEDFPEKFRGNLEIILRDGRSMTTLYLVNNDIGKIKDPQQWQAFGTVLSQLQKLVRLDLSWNGFGEIKDLEVWQAIGFALSQLPKLATLDLSWNNLCNIENAEVWQSVVDAIRENKTIISLNLDGNNLSSHNKRQLKIHIKENKLRAEKENGFGDKNEEEKETLGLEKQPNAVSFNQLTLIEKATRGDAEAQYNLGVKYEYGRGVDKDEKEAVRWYRLAAEQGDTSAQCNLGRRYSFGRGVAKDETKAVWWFKLAAEQGHAQSQCFMGWMYREGMVVAKDETKAVCWFRLAAEQGNTDAQSNLEEIADLGRGIVKDEKEADVWRSTSLENERDLSGHMKKYIKQWGCQSSVDLRPGVGPHLPLTRADAMRPAKLRNADRARAPIALKCEVSDQQSWDEHLTTLESELDVQTEGGDLNKQALAHAYSNFAQPSEKQVLRIDKGSEILFNPSEEGKIIDIGSPLKASHGFNLVPSAPQPSPSVTDVNEEREGEKACLSCCMIQ